MQTTLQSTFSFRSTCKHRALALVAALLGSLALNAQAALNVVACEPEWASLARELGGDRLNVS
jgi:zinc/manganese transport system substrate-binding protein